MNNKKFLVLIRYLKNVESNGQIFLEWWKFEIFKVFQFSQNKNRAKIKAFEFDSLGFQKMFNLQ